ncbi:MAG TPA: hypothetical protein VGL71_11135 [Urbifossiella sp.]
MNAGENGHSLTDLERENAILRSELAAAREREFHQRDTIRSLLSNGQLLDIEDVRARIAAGGPHLPQWIELEREMAESERIYREIKANPIPFRSVLEHGEQLLKATINGR